jgi:hypothetical protein
VQDCDGEGSAAASVTVQARQSIEAGHGIMIACLRPPPTEPELAFSCPLVGHWLHWSYPSLGSLVTGRANGHAPTGERQPYL